MGTLANKARKIAVLRTTEFGENESWKGSRRVSGRLFIHPTSDALCEKMDHNLSGRSEIPAKPHQPIQHWLVFMRGMCELGTLLPVDEPIEGRRHGVRTCAKAPRYWSKQGLYMPPLHKQHYPANPLIVHAKTSPSPRGALTNTDTGISRSSYSMYGQGQ